MVFGIHVGRTSVITCTKTIFLKNFGIDNNNVYLHESFWLEIFDTCVLEPQTNLNENLKLLFKPETKEKHIKDRKNANKSTSM